MSNAIVWVDIPVSNLERAMAFYSAVLGAPVSRQGGGGFVFGLLAHEGADVGGCLVMPSDGNVPSQNGPLIYLNAQGGLAQAVAAVETLGGKVLQPIHPIGPHGFRAIVLDSEGNRVALHAQP